MMFMTELIMLLPGQIIPAYPNVKNYSFCMVDDCKLRSREIIYSLIFSKIIALESNYFRKIL